LFLLATSSARVTRAISRVMSTRGALDHFIVRRGSSVTWRRQHTQFHSSSAACWRPATKKEDVSHRSVTGGDGWSVHLRKKI
jgi:hypothetical protein